MLNVELPNGHLTWASRAQASLNIQHSSFNIVIIQYSSFNIHHSLVFFPQFVVLVHGVVDALQDKALDDVNRHVDGRL